MALFKLELVFAIIMIIQKHMVMRLDREIALAIFLLWLDNVRGLTVSVAWPFAEKILRPGYCYWPAKEI